MRDLQQDACTVAGLVIRSFRTAVPHIFQYLKGRLYNVVRFTTMDVYDQSYAASVMLVGRIV